MNKKEKKCKCFCHLEERCETPDCSCILCYKNHIKSKSPKPEKKVRIVKKAWLLRNKVGKMKRSIWFLRVHASLVKHNYEEIVPVEITIKVLNSR